jgi:Putative Flp pilus-assembly TadE/G-like
MKPRSQERGQALVIIALAVVGLFGFAALAIDGSRVFSDRRNAQNAADTAALSAALAKIRHEPYDTAALDRAESNGYVTDSNSEVEVHICSDPTITTACKGIPTTGEFEEQDPDNYIQVKITSTIPATFGRIVGRNEFTNIVTAIAYSGPVEPQPVLNGAALASLKEDGDKTLFGNGNVNLEVHNSGVFNNSTSACATQINGAVGNYSVDTAFQFASGVYCSAAGNTLNPVEQVGQIDYPPTFNIPEPTISCSGNGSIEAPRASNHFTYVVHPGNFPATNITAGYPVNFEPGNYCFSGNFKIIGTAPVTADYVRFKITNGEFSLGGTSSLTCNDMLVHIDGGSGVSFGGSNKVECNNVTFYASTGKVSWEGNTIIRLFAPEGGDYKGLLIYMPYGNYEDLAISGNANSEMTGSIIAVSSNISIAGNTGTTGLHSQIIGYTVTIEGNSNLEINYVPEEQYWVVNPTAVTLTK